MIGLGIALLIATLTTAGESDAIRPEDLKRLEGATWKGLLTYRDYRTDKPTTIESNLTVTPAPGDDRAWVFAYAYPREPKADRKATAQLSKNGKVFDGETLIERKTLDDGGLRLVTEQDGMDDDKKARFRLTYLIGPSTFSIRKEVRYEGTKAFLERNIYSWNR